MPHPFSNRPRRRRNRVLVLALSGLLSQACVMPSPPTVSTERLCPFVGTEVMLAVAAIAANNPADAEVTQAIAAIIAERLAELELSAAAVYTETAGQIIVQLPLEADVDQTTRLLSRQGELTLRPQKLDTQPRLNVLLTERAAIAPTDETAIAAIDADILTLFGAPAIQSRDVREAAATLSSSGQRWEITVEFTEAGAQTFAALTQTVAGTGRAIGIFLDDQLLSAPTVDVTYAETGITGGTAVITGAFSEATAATVAAQIQSGALPAPTFPGIFLRLACKTTLQINGRI